MIKYGYARVSSKGQANDGNGLECQEKILKEAGAEVLFFETYTGTKKDRPRLDEMISGLKEGDTVIVAKLDRLSRSVHDGIEIIDNILAKGASINVLNMAKFDNTASGKLMRNIMLAFAEFERDCIVQRTQEGKEWAKANNPDYHEGGVWKIPENFSELKKEVDNKKITVTDMCKKLGICRATWYNWCKI